MRNKSKYYHFHKDHGHNTDECHYLKNQTENLIQQGKLKRIVGRSGQHYRSRKDEAGSRPQDEDISLPQAQEKEKQQAVAGEIQTIAGGLVAGGSSRSLRRAYARQVNKIHTEPVWTKHDKSDKPDVTFSGKDS